MSREEELKTKEVQFESDCTKAKREHETMRECLLREKERLIQRAKDLDERERDLDERENNLILREQRISVLEQGIRVRRKSCKREKGLENENENMELISHFSDAESDSNHSSNEPMLHVETELAEFDAIQRDLGLGRHFFIHSLTLLVYSDCLVLLASI